MKHLISSAAKHSVKRHRFSPENESWQSPVPLPLSVDRRGFRGDIHLGEPAEMPVRLITLGVALDAASLALADLQNYTKKRSDQQ